MGAAVAVQRSAVVFKDGANAALLGLSDEPAREILEGEVAAELDAFVEETDDVAVAAEGLEVRLNGAAD